MANPTRSSGWWIARAAILAVTVAAAITSLLVSYAAFAAKRMPEQVLRVWPSSEAEAYLAADLLKQANGNAPGLDATRLATEALLNQPISARAASTLGLIAGANGQPRRMTQLLRYSERLSRRDLPTQLALIEMQVQNGNVPGALVHYDRALRTSPTAAQVLLPILVPAINQPDVARALAPLLAARADWWKAFTVQMIGNPDTAPASSYLLLHALRLDASKPDEHAMAEDAMQKMAAKGRVDLAARLYAELRRDRPKPAAAIHDGGFQQTGSLAPFDWTLTDSADLSATVEARPDGKGNGLFIAAANGAGGIIARQLLIAPPGRYRLGFDLGDLAPAGPRITAAARCMGTTSPLTTVQPEPAATATSSTRRVALPIVVPPGCGGLWIEFGAQGGDGMGTTTPWIGAVAFTPIPDTA